MKIGLTGGTGFLGTALSSRLLEEGHDVVCVARGKTDLPEPLDEPAATVVRADIRDREGLRAAFAGCDAVAHLAGINRERGDQTYAGVHVVGTKAVCDAAVVAGVSRLALTSYLRARPNCGSGYLESKWAAEQLVRNAPLEHAVLKPGVVYGRGDQLLTHLARALLTVPVIPRVGVRDRSLAPLAVADLVDVLVASLVDGRLADATVPVVGPSALPFSTVVRRIGDVLGRRPIVLPCPVACQYATAWVGEKAMETPIVSRAAVRMLAEGAIEPAPQGVCDSLPADLRPSREFTREHLADELADLERFGLADLRG